MNISPRQTQVQYKGVNNKTLGQKAHPAVDAYVKAQPRKTYHLVHNKSFPREEKSCLFPHLEVLCSLSCLVDLALRLLSHGVDETGDETGSDGGDGAKVDGVAKEDHAGCGDGELVKCADHTRSKDSSMYVAIM